MTTWTVSTIEVESKAAAKPQAAVVLFVVACVLTGLMGRFAYLVRPFDHDAAMFVYLGKSVCDGDRFCHDVIDNKFPSVGLMTSIFWRMFGTNWAAYVVAQTVMAFGGVLLLARCAARHFGQPARLPTALAGMIYLNFTVAVFGGFQLETLQVSFTIVSACSAIEAMRGRSWKDALVVGLGAGCAAMLKPTGLAPLGAFWCILMLGGSGRVRMLLASLAGLCIPVAVTVVYMVAFDILRDVPTLVRQISEYASSTPMAWEDVFKPLTVLVLAGFGIVVRGWVFRRDRVTREIAADGQIVRFAVIWFVLEMIGAVMQRRMYGYHFLPVGAPAALLFGMIPRRDRAISLAAALGPIMIISVLGAREVLNYPDPRGSITPASAYLLEHTSPGDAIWQDSMPRVLLETGLRPGARFPIMFIFGNTDTSALEYTPIILSDFEQRRPKYIILPTDMDEKLEGETTYCAHLTRSPVRAENFKRAWREIEKYVKANYVAEIRLRGDTIYRRRAS